MHACILFQLLINDHSIGQVALAFLSVHYRLNPWKKIEQHQANSQCSVVFVAQTLVQDWAAVEAGVVQAMGSWCLDRFQRNRGVRRVTVVCSVVWVFLHDLSVSCGC